jgi:putative ABC transport system permease protein
MNLPVSLESYPDPKQMNAYLGELRAAVEAVPGVLETALTCAPPLQGACYGMPMQVAGRPIVDRANRQGGFYKAVSPSYFHTMGLRLLKGRALSESDIKGSPPVTVINERLAKREFANQDPIGQRILIQEIVPGKTELGPEIAWQVVGVIADEKVNGLNDESSAGVYVNNDQSPVYGMNLIVRARVDPLTIEKAIARAIHGISRNQAISDVETVEQIKSEDVVTDRMEAALMGVFATVALLLAAIGIYGVISYSVAQRTHELGVRAALGASAGSLLKLVLFRGLALTIIGILVGVAASLALTRAMASLLYGIGARDPVTMWSVGGILSLVALAACYVPARRATKVDPMVALRHE